MTNPCTWTGPNEETGGFYTSCGHPFKVFINAATVKKWLFCPYCGGPLYDSTPPKGVEDGL